MKLFKSLHQGISEVRIIVQICNMQTLKEATAVKHKAAERCPFNVRMFMGQLSPEEYLMYLHQQLIIFNALEKHPLPHPSLNRVEAVKTDISELEIKGYSSNKAIDASLKYAEYLSGLTQNELLPHVYLNYLALMFGGQMMKSKVPSSGKMYEFDNMTEALNAVRTYQKDEWADEVNKGFDFLIDIFNACETPQQQSA